MWKVFVRYYSSERPSPASEVEFGPWESKRDAIEARDWIHEHYDAYSREALWRGPGRFDASSVFKRPWCTQHLGWGYGIRLRMNSGEMEEFFTPWCGYFENLDEVRVVYIDDDSIISKTVV